MSILKPRLVAPIFFALFLGQGLFLIQATSPTTDEVAFHMVNGYAFLKTHDYRMSPANPALLREWMALPWFLFKPKLDLKDPAWEAADSVPFARDFFYRDNRAIADQLLYSARFMVLLLGSALGAVIYLWSRKLYGEWAGVLSLAFYALCPNFLAHSSIGGTDIGVTLFVTLSAYGLWRSLRFGRPADTVLFVTAYGVACAAKQNALVFFLPFLTVVYLRKGAGVFIKTAGLLLFSAFFFIWASYGFEFKPLLWQGVPRAQEKLSCVAEVSKKLFLDNVPARTIFQNAATKLPLPMPSYLLGFAGLIRSHRAPYLHYAFGKWTTDGVWYFYLFSFAVKMTLPFLLLLILRFVFFRRALARGGQENLVILLPTFFLFFITCFDKTGIGIRYLFPVIPMLFVWIGGLAPLTEDKPVRKALVCFLVLLNVLTVWPSFPDYLSYFNPLVGGTQGGLRHVRGSDVDWGQGLKALKHYMDDHGISKTSLRYFGTADPSFYGIDFEPVTEAETEKPGRKVYAVSVFFREHVRWADTVKPTALVGGSIHIYDLRSESR